MAIAPLLPFLLLAAQSVLLVLAAISEFLKTVFIHDDIITPIFCKSRF
jgi:hypothetical protein